MEMHHTIYYFQPFYSNKPTNAALQFLIIKEAEMADQTFTTTITVKHCCWAKKKKKQPEAACISYNHHGPTCNRHTYWISFCTTDKEETLD